MPRIEWRPNHEVSPLWSTVTKACHVTRFQAFSTESSNTTDEASAAAAAEEEEDTIEIVVNVPDELTIPGAEKGGRKLALVFTCAVCNTRSVKQFTERAYAHGVVIVTCPGCKKQHLIADRLGYFADDDGKTFDLNTLAERTGRSVKRVTMQGEDGSKLTTVTLEDIVGPDKMKEILQAAGTTESSPEKKSDQEKDGNQKKE